MSASPVSAIIVIPCLNEAAHIRGLVEMIAQDRSSPEMKIIIVDGGSVDGTIEIAKELSTKLTATFCIANPKKLQAGALNLAASTFGNDVSYLIRIDAHAHYPQNYCSVLVNEAQETGADSVVVGMITTGTTFFQKAVAIAQNSRLGNGGSAHRYSATSGSWVDHGHHALFDIRAFNAVRGYDETFSHNEDAELDYRLKKSGYKIWLTRKTHLFYYPRSSAGSLLRQYFKYGQGRAKTVIKHKIRLKLRQLIPAFIFPIVVLAALSPISWLFALPMYLWVISCLLYGLGLAIKSGEQEPVLAGVAAVIMHFGWSVGFWSIVCFGKRNQP